MRATRGLLTLAILLLAAGCGAATTSAGADPAAADGSRPRSDLITAEEVRQRGQFSNLYDVVQVLRPRWLHSRGPDTFMGQQGEVQVRMDGNRLGPVSALRNLAVSGVTSLRWVPPIDAAAQFGLDHGHGAILISTSPTH